MSNNQELPEAHMEALKRASLGADDILSNLDGLNEEISDISPGQLPEDHLPKAIKPRKKSKARHSTPNPEISKRKSRAELKIEQAAKAQREREGNLEMDLDSELDSLDDQLNQRAAAEAQVEMGQTMQEQIIDLLKTSKDAPGDKQIAVWKKQFGDNGVHVMGLGEGDVYVFTHLKRGQWKKIQELMAKAQESGSRDVEDELKEKVISHCVLWPKPLGVEFFYNSRAGVVDSLYQVILLNSYFLSPQQAMMLTTQL